MSKVKISGNASGTGVLTIEAPNTNTDRTITLPDAAGEFVTADASGNVGIGTTTPSVKLHSVGVDHQKWKLESSTGGDASITLTNTHNEWNLGQTTSVGVPDGWFGISDGASRRVLIDTNGVAMFGATGSTSRKHTSATQVESKDGIDNGLVCWTSKGSGSQPMVSFIHNSSNHVGTIYANPSSTSYNTTSDYRLKENVEPMTGSIDRLKELKPSRFNFIADADTTVDGFIAHEVSDIVPEAISGEKDAMRTEEYEVEPAVKDDDGNVVTEAVMGEREVPDYQGIDQAKLVPLLTSALQEAVAKIEALETRIEALENA